MAFEDLREKVAESWAITWNRFLESSTGARLAEGYENLPPAGQKGVLVGAATLGAMILLLIPWSWFSASSEKIQIFEETQMTIQDLFSTYRDSGELRAGAVAIDQGALIATIQNQLPTVRLSPEQIKSVQAYDNKAAGKKIPGVPDSVNQAGAEVRVAGLNLTQVVDVAQMIMASEPAAKLVGMDVTAAADDPRYFDVVYKVVAFSVPEPPPPAAKPRGGSRTPRAGAGGDE